MAGDEGREPQFEALMCFSLHRLVTLKQQVHTKIVAIPGYMSFYVLVVALYEKSKVIIICLQGP